MSEIRLLNAQKLGWAEFHPYSSSPPKAQTSLGEITEICKGYLRLYRTCTLRSLQNFNSEVLILKQVAPTRTSCPFNICLSYPAWKNKTKSKPLIVSYKKDSCFKVTSQSLSEDNPPWQQLFETTSWLTSPYSTLSRFIPEHPGHT